MPTLDANPAIRMAMYRVGKRQVWHWVVTGGTLACSSEAQGLQSVRLLPASEVEVATALCKSCRNALVGRKLIAELPEKK